MSNPLKILLIPFIIVFWVKTECSGKTGNITIQVLSSKSMPILNAKISLKTHQIRSGNSGYVSIENAPIGTAVVKISHPDFITTYRTISVQHNKNSFFKVYLMVAQNQWVRNVSNPNKITRKGFEVSIPKNSFSTNKSGTLQFAYINPAGNDIRAMPGEFVGQDQQGKESNIESVGAFSFSVISNGKKIDIAKGKTITVRTPYSGQVKPGQSTVPIWSFNSQTGLWIQEGEGKIFTRGTANWVEAKIPHLSWWNFDIPIRRSAIIVESFVNEKGESLFTPNLIARGLGYNGIMFGKSIWQGNSSGRNTTSNEHNFNPGSCVIVKPNAKVKLIAQFYGKEGIYESEQELNTKEGGFSCYNNPERALIIKKMVLKKIPATCIRGKVNLGTSYPHRFRINVYDQSKSLGLEYSYLNKGLVARTDSKWNGEFCIDHLPADRNIRLEFIEKNLISSNDFSLITPLHAQDIGRECKNLANVATFKVQTKKTASFSCNTNPDSCYDIKELKGKFPEYKQCIDNL